MSKQLKNNLFFFLLTGLCLFLTINKHSKTGYFNYHSEIWADKAGYYVYLPATFYYNFSPDAFPKEIDKQTGDGFQLDYKNEKVITKYTCGVAIMQAPFFGLAHLFSTATSMKTDGFSPIYHKAINIAAVFYLMLGLYYLHRFLMMHFRRKIATWTVLILFLATNLFWYAVVDTGMSHVYSFALFCLFLYLVNATQYLKNSSNKQTIALGIIIGLILLIRPTNLLFLSSFLFLDIENINTVSSRLKRIFRFKTLLILVLCIVLIMLPQFIYWNMTFNSFVSYSYENEGFHWLNPQTLKTWFSPNNGLFLYTPFYLFILFGMVKMIKEKAINGVYLLLIFLGISYIFSAWWDWTFGCSFGSRSYVEYLAIFSIPVAFVLSNLAMTTRIYKVLIISSIVVFILYNLKMIYSFDHCFHGSRNWDWEAFFQLVVTAPK